MVFKKVLAEVQLIFRTTEVKGCDIYIYNFPEGTSRVPPSELTRGGGMMMRKWRRASRYPTLREKYVQ